MLIRTGLGAVPANRSRTLSVPPLAARRMTRPSGRPASSCSWDRSSPETPTRSPAAYPAPSRSRSSALASRTLPTTWAGAPGAATRPNVSLNTVPGTG
jgi:hypothetical protein